MLAVHPGITVLHFFGGIEDDAAHETGTLAFVVCAGYNLCHGFDGFIHDGGVEDFMPAVHFVEFLLVLLQVQQVPQVGNDRQAVRKLQQGIAVAGVAGISDAGFVVYEYHFTGSVAAHVHHFNDPAAQVKPVPVIYRVDFDGVPVDEVVIRLDQVLVFRQGRLFGDFNDLFLFDAYAVLERSDIPVRHIAVVEVEVAAHMVGMAVGIGHPDRLVCQGLTEGLQVAHAEDGIDEQGIVLALDQVALGVGVFHERVGDHPALFSNLLSLEIRNFLFHIFLRSIRGLHDDGLLYLFRYA